MSHESNNQFQQDNDPRDFFDIELPTHESSPEEIKNYIRTLDSCDYPIDDNSVDTMLIGEPVPSAETSMIGGVHSRGSLEYEQRRRELHDAYQQESPWFGGGSGIWTPYNYAREIFRDDLTLNETHRLEDWGAGWGRIILYAGITTVARCTGIEMVGERVERVRQAIDKLELENARYIEKKIQDHDPSEADVIFMYQPFSSKTFREMYEMLADHSSNHPTTIAYRGTGMDSRIASGQLSNFTLVKKSQRGIRYYETLDIALTPESRVNNPYDRDFITAHNSREKELYDKREASGLRLYSEYLDY